MAVLWPCSQYGLCLLSAWMLKLLISTYILQGLQKPVQNARIQIHRGFQTFLYLKSKNKWNLQKYSTKLHTTLFQSILFPLLNFFRTFWNSFSRQQLILQSHDRMPISHMTVATLGQQQWVPLRLSEIGGTLSSCSRASFWYSWRLACSTCSTLPVFMAFFNDLAWTFSIAVLALTWDSMSRSSCNSCISRMVSLA